MRCRIGLDQYGEPQDRAALFASRAVMTHSMEVSVPQFQKIDACLCFDGNAEEAANFYVSMMEDSRIVQVLRHGPEGSGPEGTVLAVTFQLAGQPFIALNGGPDTKFSPSVSFMVKCETQEEIDHIWGKLLDGGEPMVCGWIRDRYGLTWQVTPTLLLEMIHDSDREAASRAMRCMMEMVKLEIAPLKAAFQGEGA
jgi:predicted 3-demethylubiquinone-9 3-methyltransferase (glyoxalase superfamily)